MESFLQRLKQSKIKTKTKIQNIYGVKTAKPLPLQILANVFKIETIYTTLQFLVCGKITRFSHSKTIT